MAKSPATIVVDGQDPGNPDKRQSVNASGQVAIQNQPNMDVALSTRATESTAAGIKTGTDKIPADPAREGGNLATAASKLTTIDGHVDVNLSTRASAATQTDGTQKAIIRGGSKGATTPADITSTSINADHQGVDVRNWGGGTQGSQQVEGLAPAGSAPEGNPVWIGGHDGALIQALRTVLDGTIQRLQAEAKVGKGLVSGDLVHLDALDTTSGRGRLKATLYSPDDDPIAFTAVPPNPASIRNDFVRNGGSASLLVDGSVTPVYFDYLADLSYDISLQEIVFVLAASSVPMGTNYFGSLVGGLTNGLLVEVTSDGNTGTLANMTRNEDFVNFASPGGFTWVVSSKDLMSATYNIGGGLKLKAGTADKIRVTVRDNVSGVGTYFQCFVKGNLL